MKDDLFSSFIDYLFLLFKEIENLEKNNTVENKRKINQLLEKTKVDFYKIINDENK